jgi:hypothetical protein
MLVQAGLETKVRRPIGGTPAAATQVVRLEHGRKHWPIPSATQRCLVCSARGVTTNVSVICQRCDVLCVDKKCFVDYHKANP